MFLNKKYFTTWFWIILVIKLIVGSVLASSFMSQGFVPFVNYFVTSGFQNPYDYFVSIGQATAFPYPPVMLAVFGLVRFLFGWLPEQADLFIMRLPLLAADIVIYVILCRWLELKEKTVLWLYWASPVLFYINYVHGQLDVVPTALLLISLALLFKRQTLLASVILGVGIATKTHLLAVVPFYFIYFYANRYSFRQQVGQVCVCLLVAIGLMSPYLWSSGFSQSVFGTAEAAKVYLVHLPFFEQDLKFLLAPAAVFILFLNFLPYRKINRDAFLLVLGLLFTVFVVFVPPMPGWLYWSLPFYVYFFAKYKEIPRLSFWSLTLSYLCYVMLSQGDIVVANPVLLNLTFTLFIAALVMNAVWIYRLGVRSNLEYKSDHSPLVIGIGGDSGAGKNTLVGILQDLFGTAHTTVIEGDDAHKWERHDTHWQQQTHLDPKSNRLHEELIQTIGLKTGDSIQRTRYDHGTGRFASPNRIEGRRNIIYVGLHPFYLSKMRQLFTIKIYVEPDEALRRHWKIMRDMEQRGRSKAEILEQIEQREVDANQYIRPQRQFADLIVSFSPRSPLVDGQTPEVFLKLTCDNSIHLDPLMAALSTTPTMLIEHKYDVDLHHQTIEFSGQISADQLRQAIYTLLPNLDELLHNSPIWRADYDGIIQLFMLYYYSEFNKTR
ncbi:MAG: DUF2029 domain-containing protein [Candidatus Kerfeldbacteria bacterium]|nr:DUF2029 domain-containing protein [Candidatus Kerfeldbacteria bacterium]